MLDGAVRFALVLFLVSGAGVVYGTGLPDLDPARVKADIDYLCSVELAGRETGTAGAAKAAAYVAGKMQEAGLEPIVAGGLGGVTPYHFPWTYTGTYELYRPDRGGLLPLAVQPGEASDVVGVLPGRDPVLAGEYVFITAHFDHLGTVFGTLYPGADDDASGTAGLLEVMRLLRESNPRRSIAFLGVSGEEEGLLGSEAFLAKPPLPITAIKADINMDMIGRGRRGELHVMPAKREGYVSTLTRDARAIASGYGVALSAGLENYWEDSDHYSFARRFIPAICFNTGLHPDYHQPTDTPDKINYAGLTRAVRIVRDLALKTANADAAPAVLPPNVWRAWVWGPYRTPNHLAAGSTTGLPEEKNQLAEPAQGRAGFGL